MAGLPYLPSSVLKDTESWNWTSTVQNALGSIKDAGAELMKPIGQHVADAMPTPPPFQTPEVTLPEVRPFTLPDLSSWGFGSPAAPAAPQQPPADQGFDLQPATTPTATAPRRQPARPSGGFSLPDISAWGMGSTTPPAAAPGRPASSAAAPSAGPAPSDVNGYLTYAAQKAGIDPAQVLAVMGKEGPTGWDSVGRFDTGTSYGPLQLHYAGGSNPKEGMGDRFTKATGIDLRTDSSVQAHQAAVDFALGELAKRGDWSAWYGADNAFPAAQGGQGRFTKVNRVAPTQAAGQGGQQSPAATGGGLDVAGITKAYAGVPYTFGGPGGRSAGLGATTDCSGFVSAVWKSQYGLDLPAHTDAAYNALKQQGAVELSQADARPGDVVFYMGAGTGGAITHHMGVYAGNGQVLDMSTSGGAGVRPRAVGHGGQFVILRDPRLSQETPKSAAAPAPIVPTGVAERTCGQKLPQPQNDALSNRPTPADPAPDAFQPAASAAAAAPPVRDDWRTAGVSVVHPNVARAFEAANGRPPTPEETAELASLGFG